MEEQKCSFVTIIHKRRVTFYRAPLRFSVSHKRLAAAVDVCNQMFNFILAVGLYQSLGLLLLDIFNQMIGFGKHQLWGAVKISQQMFGSISAAVVDFNPFWDSV